MGRSCGILFMIKIRVYLIGPSVECDITDIQLIAWAKDVSHMSELSLEDALEILEDKQLARAVIEEKPSFYADYGF